MPCYVTGSREGDAELAASENYQEAKKLRAMLCGVLTAARKVHQLRAVLKAVDEAECGVTQEAIAQWWAKHQEADEDRKRRDARDREDHRLREQARQKLSAEERRVLGIK